MIPEAFDTLDAMPGADLAPVRLLMIDDDIKLCQLVRDYLEPLGFDVSFAHTGADGLARALDSGYRAIILDVMLPGIDGFEVLRRLRAALIFRF